MGGFLKIQKVFDKCGIDKPDIFVETGFSIHHHLMSIIYIYNHGSNLSVFSDFQFQNPPSLLSSIIGGFF